MSHVVKSEKKIYNDIEKYVEDRLIAVLNDVDLGDNVNTAILERNRFYSISKSSVNRKQTKNISGYNLFCRELFPSIKEDNEGVATKDLLRIIAATWKEQDQDTKNNFNQRAKSIPPKQNKK